eukprot:CAMPEP_0119266472 /NCGR_PEP_ID=MMETSP1329-20130426/4953_1 /TAXON_ID=114041 /ORGANISM="Genus nov. species nov., Strain RCC1024" /LENGTH=106 /DNA_ID=CAMNT_0007266353 /DNA_START=144 /DNA_END=462 /DNA_ORIENTATION=-
MQPRPIPMDASRSSEVNTHEAPMKKSKKRGKITAAWGSSRVGREAVGSGARRRGAARSQATEFLLPEAWGPRGPLAAPFRRRSVLLASLGLDGTTHQPSWRLYKAA